MSAHNDKAESHAEHAGSHLSDIPDATRTDVATRMQVAQVEVLLSIGQRLARIAELLEDDDEQT